MNVNKTFSLLFVYPEDMFLPKSEMVIKTPLTLKCSFVTKTIDHFACGFSGISLTISKSAIFSN